MDRKLVLEYVRVTEAAAIACSRYIGRGKKDIADAAAVEAMRTAFDKVPVRGRIVIGEGEMDEAPMLYIGEQVGPQDQSLPQVDIAVDPLEGTNLCAHGIPGAMAVLAVANRGDLLHAPDIYMDKVATGAVGRGVVSLENSPKQNVKDLARAKGCSVHDITVVVLDRPRHEQLIAELREAGARVRLISDGDVNPSVAAGLPDSGIDMFLGSGGAPEGVISAAALYCLGGEFQGRLLCTNEQERDRAKSMGIPDPDRIMSHHDIVRGDCIFVASGVTEGPLVRGVQYRGNHVRVFTLALRSFTGTIRYFETLTAV